MTPPDAQVPRDPAGSDAGALERLGERLRDGRPVPAPAFRVELRRRLAGASELLAGAAGRPARPAAGLLLAGSALMGFLVASVLGAGPLAP